MTAFDMNFLKSVQNVIARSVEEVVKPGIARGIKDKAAALTVKDGTHYDGKDYVTSIDTDNQKYLLAALDKILPGATALGEEDSEKDFDKTASAMMKGYSWVVDPLDGTNNVAKRINGDIGDDALHYGVMAALLKDGQPIAGWIYYNQAGIEAHKIGEGMIYGGFGLGFFSGDGARIDFSKPAFAADNLVVTTVSAYPKDYQPLILENVAAGKVAIYDPPPKSAAVESALFLTGKASAIAFRRFRIWDHAPLFALVPEAGGYIKLMNGEDFDLTAQNKNGAFGVRSKELWQAMRHDFIGDVHYDHTS